MSTDPDDLTMTGWTGWIAFASTMLIIIGCFSALAGFVGIFKDNYWLVPEKQLVVVTDYTTWGWIHLILGLIAIGTAVGLFAGALWARIVAIIFAVVSALANVAFINANPVWSTIIIALNVIVIWAITVHGKEMKAMS